MADGAALSVAMVLIYRNWRRYTSDQIDVTATSSPSSLASVNTYVCLPACMSVCISAEQLYCSLLSLSPSVSLYVMLWLISPQRTQTTFSAVSRGSQQPSCNLQVIRRYFLSNNRKYMTRAITLQASLRLKNRQDIRQVVLLPGTDVDMLR